MIRAIARDRAEMGPHCMPGLAWPGGCFAILGLMPAVAAGMPCWFNRRGWM